MLYSRDIARLREDKENEVLIFALFITTILRSFEHATKALRELQSNIDNCSKKVRMYSENIYVYIHIYTYIYIHTYIYIYI